ncbi:MAG: hypothetical protein ACKO3R_10750 [bacterium]
MEKKDLVTALSAPESINRKILDDQLKGILNQVTSMVRTMVKTESIPAAKAAFFIPNIKEESSSVINLMDPDQASVSLQVAGEEYLFKKNNEQGLLLPKQDNTIAKLLGSKDLETILPSDQDIIANQKLTGDKLRKKLPKFASEIETLFTEKRLYENQENSQISTAKPILIRTQMQDSQLITLTLEIKNGKLNSLFISPTFDHNEDNTFFMLCAKS